MYVFNIFFINIRGPRFLTLDPGLKYSYAKTGKIIKAKIYPPPKLLVLTIEYLVLAKEKIFIGQD